MHLSALKAGCHLVQKSTVEKAVKYTPFFQPYQFRLFFLLLFLITA
jgi:hypothetical protein